MQDPTNDNQQARTLETMKKDLEELGTRARTQAKDVNHNVCRPPMINIEIKAGMTKIRTSKMCFWRPLTNVIQCIFRIELLQMLSFLKMCLM